MDEETVTQQVNPAYTARLHEVVQDEQQHIDDRQRQDAREVILVEVHIHSAEDRLQQIMRLQIHGHEHDVQVIIAHGLFECPCNRSHQDITHWLRDTVDWLINT